MPYVLSWEPGVVIKTFTGHLGCEEFVQSVVDVAAHENFDALRFIINDCRECTGHSIDFKALESVAAIRFGAMNTNPNIRVIVVSTDPAFAELANAAKRPPLQGTQRTVVFPTIEQARNWIAQQPELHDWRYFGG